MGMSVQELKHAARLQEWSARVAECRSSGIGVKAWCAEHSIALKTYYNWEKQIVKAATQKYIELAHVLGWQCVVNKGQFRPMDSCVYFAIDSFLPVCPEFEFLRSPAIKKRK